MPQTELDVLVLGAGAAGMTAALAAQAAGFGVHLVEATAQVGGTTATSAGTLWLPAVDGAPAEREAAATYLRACIGPQADPRKVDALLDSGRELLAFLRERTRVRLEPVPVHPDYLQHLPGATLGGRAYAPTEFDGRLLGRDFAHIRQPLPEFMVLGGMMVSKADIPQLLAAGRDPGALRHAARLVARYAADRVRGYARGTRLVMGNALVAQLYASVRDARIPVHFETTVGDVQRDGEGFLLTLRGPGSGTKLRVRKALVVASGGYAGNPDLRRRWLPQAAQGQSVSHPGNTGGGLALAQALGGSIEAGHPQPAFWMPVSSMRRSDGSIAHFPHIVLDRAKPGSLAVDGSGRRFTNEADSYHHFCVAMLRALDAAPEQRFHLVADHAFVDRYGLGLIRPGARLQPYVQRGYLTVAGSPQELAARLRIDADTFAQTLARYNAHAARGEDPDYGRGASALNRHNGDPAQQPNPCLRPLDGRRLCAVELKVADLATSVGLAADEHGRVLDAAGHAIPGLYACGNDMASMMRGAYPGPGTTLGPGMTYAWRAMRHLAATA